MNPNRNDLTFDGRPLSYFGVYISGSGTYGAPQRDIKMIEVPGRNGALIQDNGRYKNITVSYDAFIIRGFEYNIEELRNYLMARSDSYYRLEDTYHIDEYRMASFSGPFSPNVTDNLRYAKFTLQFSCKPQRFLKSGEASVTLTASGKVRNPEDQTALPVMTVYGNGKVEVGDRAFTIASSSHSSITVNSVTEDCYDGAENCNSLVNFQDDLFPVLHSGSNGITLGTGITKVVITPGWWKL